MLGAGEWWRRGAPQIAQGVTAAGIAALFASFLAALNLYHLVNQTVGFVLLAATTAAAVALSVRQGPFVALLGLIGGFATPGLIGSTEPRPGPLFTYLFVLQVGLLVVTRSRGWWAMSGLTFVGSLVWVGVWLFGPYRPEHSLWIGPFLVASISTFVLATYQQVESGQMRARHAHLLSILGAVAGMSTLAVVVRVSGFSGLDWTFLGFLGAGAIVLARVDRRYEPIAWIAAAMGIALLAAWRGQAAAFDAGRFAVVAIAFGAVYAGGAYAALWGAHRPARWATLSVAAAVAYLLTAYWLLPEPPKRIGWGGVCLILSGAYLLATVPVYHRRAAWTGGDAALAALAVAVTSFVSLAIPIELKHEWIAVAWSLEVPALALIGWHLRVPALPTLAGVLACLTAAWLVYPGVLEFPLGTHIILNRILYGYGVPTVSFAVAAWLYRRQALQRLAEGLEAGAVLFTFLLVTLEVRHAFHPDRLGAATFTFREWSGYVNAWLILSGALRLCARRWVTPALTKGGRFIAAASGLLGLVVFGAFLNPLWQHESIGAARIANDLLYLYGLPALIMLLIAELLRRAGDRDAARLAGIWSLTFFVLLVGLQTRQWFHGEFLDRQSTTIAEWCAYVSGWLVIAGGLLAAAMRWPSSVPVRGGYALTVLAAFVGLITLALTHCPLWRHEPVGTTRIFNWLLVYYGLPLALGLGVAELFRRRGAWAESRLAGVWSLIFFLLLATLQTRQWFCGQFLDGPGPKLAEWSAYASVWLIVGGCLIAASARWPSIVLVNGGRWITATALGIGLLTIGLGHNPLWKHESVGHRRILNLLPAIYGLPAALAAGIAVLLQRTGGRVRFGDARSARPGDRGATVPDVEPTPRDRRTVPTVPPGAASSSTVSDPRFAIAAGCWSLLASFLLVTLEVRQWFHGPYLDRAAASNAEWYAYSAAWVVFGTLLLVLGIITQGLTLRWASLLVMLLAVGKVFLSDTAHLRDLYRVLSLLGLGASLLLLAFLYQRFVFRRGASLRRLLEQNEFKLCTKCRYSLLGLDPEGRCPECGTQFRIDDVQDHWRQVIRGADPRRY
jgi:uncharacterized membrane protein